MKYRVPDYYKDFSCIGSKCKNNCCIGWEIDIDDKTLKDYYQVEGEFGKRLHDNIIHEDSAYFKMDKKGRCAFLNKNNLCDIFTKLGENHLCQICTDHPRFYNEFADIKEIGIGLSCEVAADLILNQKEPVSFLETGNNLGNLEEMFIFYVRNKIFEILQNRKLDMSQRINLMLEFTQKMQNYVNQGKHSLDLIEINIQDNTQKHWKKASSAESWEQWKTILLNLEILDDTWKKLLMNTDSQKNIQINDIFYEQLLVYFIYRHFMHAINDKNMIDKVKFAVISCHIIARIIQENDLNNMGLIKEDIPRLYSKEVEYSDENQEIIFDEILFESF
ncbi:flagellin lysine-N-methylase [Anaerostipes faecalis]|uniref:flagellin lysine-N-methylase n=1 Tax=Anaerostipes faecalis TaxID=2738446 RepID=UPI003EFC82FB